MTQPEELEQLLSLMKEHPELPVVPFVDTDVVCDDCCSWWLGSWVSAGIENYYIGDERVHEYEPDDWDSIEETLRDAKEISAEEYERAEDEAVNGDNDAYAMSLYERLNWVKAIVVYIGLPEK